MKTLTRFFLLTLPVCIGAISSVAAEGSATITNTTIATPIEITGIHNAFRVSEKIYSGSQPEDDAAFAALRKLGIKTILTVDGGKPDVELARKHGLRYVHLPIGYDGIPTNRVAELAKLASEMNGPMFVHCHHGKHRGPAAVAVLCEISEGWSAEKAVAFLKQAGTAHDYSGLYRAAREFKMPTAAEQAAVKSLPEIATTSSLVDAMVLIDEHFDRLKKSQAVGWKTPPGHADVSPAHEATMMWEQFREMARLPEIAKPPEDFRRLLAESEKSSDSIRNGLKNSQPHSELDKSFKQLSATCSACHKKYRN